ncbi:MAG: S66 peptidase family protein [Desulfomonilaceae bacterium]
MKTPHKSADPRRILIPPPIKAGDLIGVVAASGPPIPELLSQGIRFFQEKGFRVREGCHLRERNAYLAGEDSQRCQDLNSMLRDPEIRAVFLARGGYGVMRLLDSIDHGAIFDDPKILLGMSDVTALQLSLYTLCGLVTYAGPMIAGQIGEGLDRVSEDSLMQALTEPQATRELFRPFDESVRIVRSGKASGRLVGGCLSLVVSLLGTRHCPEFKDTILFLEDVHEPPYRIDRMLTQLKLAGVLDRVNALILGYFTGQDDEDLMPEAEGILLGLIGDRPIPIVSRFPHGHALPNVILPHGLPVRLDTETRSIMVTEDRNEESSDLI